MPKLATNDALKVLHTRCPFGSLRKMIVDINPCQKGLESNYFQQVVDKFAQNWFPQGPKTGPLAQNKINTCFEKKAPKLGPKTAPKIGPQKPSKNNPKKDNKQRNLKPTTSNHLVLRIPVSTHKTARRHRRRYDMLRSLQAVGRCVGKPLSTSERARFNNLEAAAISAIIFRPRNQEPISTTFKTTISTLMSRTVAAITHQSQTINPTNNTGGNLRKPH